MAPSPRTPSSCPGLRRAAQAGVSILPGDFDNDGRTDIALTGGSGWSTLPIAFSNGDGTFRVTNATVGDFARLAAP